MLAELKFASIGIARKDFVAELCHFLIKDGTVSAFDGLISVSVPIEVEIHAKPHAREMLKAVAACDPKSPVALYVTKAGKLGIKSGKFKAFIPCLSDESEMSLPKPEGADVVFTPELYESLVALAPFMALDASRPWAMGLRVVGDSTYATNNIILAQRWHGSNFPQEIIIPKDAVNEIVRMGKQPTRVQMTHNSISFWFGENQWLRTQLVDAAWPDNVDRIFATGGNVQPFPEGFFEALQTLKAFGDDRDRVYFKDGELSTSPNDGEGASVACAVTAGGIYNGSQLRALEGAATAADFSLAPAPAPFTGKMLRGVVTGMRQ